MSKKIILFYMFLLLILPVFVFSQNTIFLNEKRVNYNLNFDEIGVFEDKKSELTIENAKKTNFQKLEISDLNSGYSDSKFWFKFNLKSEKANRWIFNISGTQIDNIEFYEIFENGKLNSRVSGDSFPFSHREIQAPTFGFYVNFIQNETRTIYISIKSTETKQFIFRILAEEYLNKTLNEVMFRWFFYFGMLFMMFIYNFLLFTSIRDISYLYYVFYIASFAMMQFAIFGYGNMFFWGENVWFGNRAQTFFAGLTTVFITLFSYNYLNIKVLLPHYKFVFVYMAISGFFIAFTNMIIQPSTITNQFPAIISLANVVIMLTMGSLVLRKGYEPAKYYMLAWGILFVSLAIFILNALGVFPKSNLSNLILPVGCLVEVTLLSFALGKKITISEKEKTAAQKEVVKQLKANDLVRSRIARDLHDDLGSTLSSIYILSEFAKKENKNNPENLPSLLNRITLSAQKIQENLQDIVWTAQNKEDKIDNLLVRMRLFGGEILETKNIDYQIVIDKYINQIKLNSDVQYDIFMIYKEAVNNIVKYSNATKVDINFLVENSILSLNISDNGIGFDFETEKTGNGLKNIKHRTETIGGIVTVDSKLGKGTVIILNLPVPK